MSCKDNNNYSVGRGNCNCDFTAKIFGACNPNTVTLDADIPATLNWTEISVPEILCIPPKKPDIEYIDQVHANAQVDCVKLLETPYNFDVAEATPHLTAVPLAVTGVTTYDVIVGSTVITGILGNNVYIYSATGTTNTLNTEPNEEGTCLTGRKLIVEGTLKQKVVYTADVDVQSVHSAHYEIPFSAFIIPYTKIEQRVAQAYQVVEAGKAYVGAMLGGTGLPTGVATGILSTDVNIDLCEEFCVDSFIEDIFITALDERTMFKNVTLFLRAKPVTACSVNI